MGNLEGEIEINSCFETKPPWRGQGRRSHEPERGGIISESKGRLLKQFSGEFRRLSGIVLVSPLNPRWLVEKARATRFTNQEQNRNQSRIGRARFAALRRSGVSIFNLSMPPCDTCFSSSRLLWLLRLLWFMFCEVQLKNKRTRR